VVVVDNASGEETRDLLRSHAGIRLILNDENRLWAAGCNQGIEAADPRSRYVLLLNSDVALTRDDWLEVLLAVMESHPRAGIAGPRHHRREVSPLWGWISGACRLIRRRVLAEVGGLNAERWPWSGASMELCVAAFARGWLYRRVHRADAFVVHQGEGSRTPEVAQRLAALPHPGRLLPQVMREYGLEPRRARLPDGWVPAAIRRLRERRRFYYAPPVGDVARARVRALLGHS
jgi:GT2 family glycosyltransferase